MKIMFCTALLRGVNVGGNRRIEMDRLRALAESLGYGNVSSYINSGNLLFSTDETTETAAGRIGRALEEIWGVPVPVLVKTGPEILALDRAVPPEWTNDKEHKTDIAFLFPQADRPEILEELPVKREHLDLLYLPGAVVWHVRRELQNQSQLNRLVSHRLYAAMTVRNVNTLRYLAGAAAKAEREG